MQVNLYVGL